MPNFRDLFPTLFRARFAEKAAARVAAANEARDNACESFQRLLRDKGYVGGVAAPSTDGGDEPARDTQDHPSTNPTAGEASREGPVLRPADKHVEATGPT